MPDTTSTDGPADDAAGGPGGKKKFTLLEGKSQQQREKILVIAAVLTLIVTVLLLRRSSSAAAATGAAVQPASGTTSGTDSSIDPLTGVPYSQELYALQAQLGATGMPSSGGSSSPTPISSTPAPAPSPSPTGSVAKPPPSPHVSIPFNPFPVGTVVAKGESIIQAVQIPGGWLDVTSEGGLYTSPGIGVSGSAYSGKPGKYSAAVNGKTVYEYTPGGVRQFKLK